MILNDPSRLPMLLTAQEANILLRMHWNDYGKALSYLRRQGRIKGVRIGNRYLYPREEILRLIGAGPMTLPDESRLPLLLTGREVQTLLQKDWKDLKACLGRLRRKGALKGLRLSRRYLYRRQEVLRFLKGQA